MRRKYQKLFALLCAALLLAGSVSQSALAAGETAGRKARTEPKVLFCTEIPLYIEKSFIGSGIVVNSVVYVPLLAFTEYMLPGECTADWDQETGTARIVAESFDLTLTTNSPVMTVNDRYYWLEDGVYNINGTIVVPLRTLARVFSLSLDPDSERWSMLIDASESSLPRSGGEVYDQDALFWLSRVISAEARNQPLEGMIGVGNVVLNRTSDNSGLFEDTVEGVIFQYGQFDVVSNGTIYAEPTDSAVLAAKLCLEGYNTVGDSLWFVNPYIGQAWWFNLHTSYETTIGDHAFYA